MIAKNSRTAFVAVLPRPVKDYDQDYFARIVDILNKALEQFQQPREATLSRLVITDFGDGSPLDPNTPGEVYLLDSPTLGAKVLVVDGPAVATDVTQGTRGNPGNVVLPADPAPWLAIPGCSLILSKPGRYMLQMNVTFVQSGSGDVGRSLQARFAISGGVVDQPEPQPIAFFYVVNAQGNTISGATVSQQSIIQLNSGTATVYLEAIKSAGASGQSYVNGAHTLISAVWVSGPVV